MPFYEVYHAISLSDQQRDDLAEALTVLHISQFRVPRLFVNVSFSDVSTAYTYIGGKRRKANYIRASVRMGNRTNDDFLGLCYSIQKVWPDIVDAPAARHRTSLSDAKQYGLHSVIIRPSNPVGLEAGFELPLAGQDQEWLRKNWAEFQSKAADGDDEFSNLVADVQGRSLLSQGDNTL